MIDKKCKIKMLVSGGVVSEYLPDNTVVAGIPARVIKSL
jgi:acetyltransferase-like isoleucine patch superfamily enzyme